MSMQRTGKDNSSTLTLLTLLLAFASLLALYWLIRYGGPIVDGDGTRLTLPAEGIIVEGNLIPKLHSYNSGYEYPALLALLSQLSGSSVRLIQLNSAVWILVLSLVAFVVYRELLENDRIALLAVVILLLLPDFLFYILRGSHEKITWFFALLLLYLLSRSYRSIHDLPRLIIYTCLFYLVLGAMVANNTFFASTFIAALGLSFAGGILLRRWSHFRDRRPDLNKKYLQRMFLISLAGLVAVFAFIAFIYPPAENYLRELSNAADRISSLFFGAEPARVQSGYRYLQTAWRSPWIYSVLSGAQWIFVLISLVAWLLQGLRLPKLNYKRWLVWLMYGGFLFILGLAYILDLAGFMNENLRMRVFTPFTLFVSPLAAVFIYHIFQDLGLGWRKIAILLLLILFSWAAVATSLKATIDPIVGNIWIFYSPPELNSMEWVDEHVTNQRIWVDIYPHQVDVLTFWKGYNWTSTNTYEDRRPSLTAPYILISRLTRLQANRSTLSTPSTAQHNQVYHNGDVRLFQRRPQTPYQR